MEFTKMADINEMELSKIEHMTIDNVSLEISPKNPESFDGNIGERANLEGKQFTGLDRDQREVFMNPAMDLQDFDTFSCSSTTSLDTDMTHPSLYQTNYYSDFSEFSGNSSDTSRDDYEPLEMKKLKRTTFFTDSVFLSPSELKFAPNESEHPIKGLKRSQKCSNIPKLLDLDDALRKRSFLLKLKNYTMEILGKFQTQRGDPLLVSSSGEGNSMGFWRSKSLNCFPMLSTDHVSLKKVISSAEELSKSTSQINFQAHPGKRSYL